MLGEIVGGVWKPDLVSTAVIAVASPVAAADDFEEPACFGHLATAAAAQPEWVITEGIAPQLSGIEVSWRRDLAIPLNRGLS